MAIGTGIFLAGTLIALVLLYGFTKDRWSWRKIFLYPLVGVISVGVVLFSGSLVWNEYEDFNKSKPRRIELVVKLNDLSIGMNQADAIFHLGAPSSQEKNEEENYTRIVWNDRRTIGWFRGNKIYRIIHFSPETYSELAGVRVQDKLQKVLKKLGKPSRISTNSDNTIRGYNSDEYGVAFGMTEGRVREFSVYDPQISKGIQYKDGKLL